MRNTSVEAETSPFAAAVAAAQMAMVVTDARAPDNPVVFINDAFTRLTGFTAEDVQGRNCRFMQGPDTSPEHVELLRRAVAEKRDVAVDILNYRRDGTPFWNALYISPVRNEAGELTHFFGAQLDATSKKAFELELQRAKSGLEVAVEARTRELTEMLAQKTALLHEVDHRVKNNLQLIASLIMLQIRRTPDAAGRDALSSMLQRVSAISTVHRRLFHDDDIERFDLAALVRDLAEDRGGEQPAAAELGLPSMAVPAAKAAPLALIVNELLTYALAGAPSEPFQFSVERVEDRLRVEAQGSSGTGTSSVFGREIIDMLARQLHAEATLEERNGMRLASLSLPIEG